MTSPGTEAEQQLAQMFMAGLRDGSIPPTVTPNWYLPGLEPDESTSLTERTAYLVRRGQFFAAAPAIVSQYMAAVQGAIDAWDRQDLARTFLEATVYIEHVKRVLIPMIIEQEEGASLAQIMRLSEGLEHVRAVNLARVRENRMVSSSMMDQTLGGVVQLSLLSWQDGVPQKAAGAAPIVPDKSKAGEFEAQVSAIAAVLDEKLRTIAKEDLPRDPLIPDLERQIARRLAGKGRVRLTHDAIPARDVFYEFLAHRYAYDPALPLFGQLLAVNGYSHQGSYDFESRAGLSFTIVMPRPERRGELPPVVVFRGTQVSDLQDIRTDLEFQIGQSHFGAVTELGLGEMLLGAAVDAGGLKPHLTGHSLGGALAQLTAAHWPERVGAVVTFQSPGLTRLNAKRAAQRSAECALEVRHYIADRDVVHLAGQRHLEGETVLVTGLHVDRGEGWEWGLGHTDLLLAGHRMRSKLVASGLTAIWCPHQLSAFTRLPDHPTTLGSGVEMARGGMSLGVLLSKSVLSGPRRPSDLVRTVRALVAMGLAQETPSLRRGSLEIGANLVTSVQRAMWLRVTARTHVEEQG